MVWAGPPDTSLAQGVGQDRALGRGFSVSPPEVLGDTLKRPRPHPAPDRSPSSAWDPGCGIFKSISGNLLAAQVGPAAGGARVDLRLAQAVSSSSQTESKVFAWSKSLRSLGHLTADRCMLWTCSA